MVTRPARTRRESAPSEEVETTERQPPPSAAHMLALQRTAGNAAVTQLVRGRTLQRFKKGDFASMAMYGLDVETMADFERRVGEVVHQRRLVQILDALHAMPWTDDVLHAMGVVRRQSKELAWRAQFPPRRRPRPARLEPEEVEEETEPVTVAPAAAAPQTSKQQQRPTAMVGFEFQQLDSKVVVEDSHTDEPEDDDDYFYRGEPEEDATPSDLPPPVPIQAFLYGHGNKWTVVKDTGDNLEFVTVPFRTLEDLRATLTEIAAVARLLTTAKPGSRYQLGTATITILKPGSSAQPQVNPDIPLDALPRLMLDAASDPALRQDLFSVDTKFWRRTTTDNELAMTATAAARIQGLTLAALARGVGVAEARLTPAAAGSVRGLLQLLANACIHREHFRTKGVQKDQPVLSKVHLGHAWTQLAEEGCVGEDASHLADLLASLYPAFEDDAELHADTVAVLATAVPMGTDPVWSRDTYLVGIEDQRKQALVEFRRAPVIPIDQWLDYAIRCYGLFITDAARRFD